VSETKLTLSLEEEEYDKK